MRLLLHTRGELYQKKQSVDCSKDFQEYQVQSGESITKGNESMNTPTIVNCPHCNCFHGPKEVRGNIPCMVCETCRTVFLKDMDRTILHKGIDVDD